MNSHFCSQNKLNRKIFLLLLIFGISGCGRKKRDFLSFDSKPETEKVNRLTLPAIKGIGYKKKGLDPDSNIELSWSAPDFVEKNRTLVGYNVYKFTTTSFVPKKPINRTPLKTTFYREKLNKDGHKNVCFLVRALFLIRKKTIEGPASQIVCMYS